jgi:hypothetical protein
VSLKRTVQTDGSRSDSPVEYWAALAMSADGGKVVAAAKDGGIYVLQTAQNPSLSITASGGKAIISRTIPSMSFASQESSNVTGINWTQVRPARQFVTVAVRSAGAMPAFDCLQQVRIRMEVGQLRGGEM